MSLRSADLAGPDIDIWYFSVDRQERRRGDKSDLGRDQNWSSSDLERQEEDNMRDRQEASWAISRHILTLNANQLSDRDISHSHSQPVQPTIHWFTT